MAARRGPNVTGFADCKWWARRFRLADDVIATDSGRRTSGTSALNARPVSRSANAAGRDPLLVGLERQSKQVVINAHIAIRAPYRFRRHGLHLLRHHADIGCCGHHCRRSDKWPRPSSTARAARYVLEADIGATPPPPRRRRHARGPPPPPPWKSRHPGCRRVSRRCGPKPPWTGAPTFDGPRRWLRSLALRSPVGRWSGWQVARRRDDFQFQAVPPAPWTIASTANLRQADQLRRCRPAIPPMLLGPTRAADAAGSTRRRARVYWGRRHRGSSPRRPLRRGPGMVRLCRR